MADVFVSYASEDRERAEALVDVLKAQGWSVWWDRDIAPGSNWDDSIHQGMSEARVMIVLWSPSSVTSRMVKDEANFAANKDALVPALIEPCEIPYGYGMLQAANLIDWEGDTDHPGLVQMLGATRRLLGRKTEAIKAPPNPRGRRRRWLVPAALLLPLPLIAALGTIKLSRFKVRATIRASEVRFRLAGSGSTEQLALSGVSVSKLRAVELPPARDTTYGIVAGDRLVLRAGIAARQAGPAPLGMRSLRRATLALSPMILPDSTLVRLLADGPQEHHLALTHPRLQRLTISVAGPIGVVARPAVNREVNFEAGAVGVQPDSGQIALDLVLRDTAAVLSPALEIRGIDFWRLVSVREGDQARDDRVSTIDEATIMIQEIERPGPPVAAGVALVLEEAAGQISNLRLSPAGIIFNFDGTVRSLGVDADAESAPYRLSWFSVVTANHLAALIALLLLYATVATIFALSLRKRWA